jgi:hypothetical protein
LEDQARIGQTTLNQYFTASSPVHKNSLKCVSRKDWISSRVLPDESIESIWCPYTRSRLKITSRSLWLGISLLSLCWCRWPSYHSCRKM